MTDIKIEMEGHGRGRVLVDGIELPSVAAVSFSARPGTANRVLIELTARTVVVSGEAELVDVTPTGTEIIEHKKGNGHG